MDSQRCRQFVAELALLRDEAGTNSSPANVRSLLKRLALIYDVACNSEPTFAAGIFQTMAACLPLAEAVLEVSGSPGSTEMGARQARLRQALDTVVETGARLAGIAPPPAANPGYQAPPVPPIGGARSAPPSAMSGRASVPTRAPEAPVRQEPTNPEALAALKRERDEALHSEIEARAEYHTACQQLNRLREENTALQARLQRAQADQTRLQQEMAQGQQQRDALQRSLERAQAEAGELQRTLEARVRKAEEREQAASRAFKERLAERDRRIDALLAGDRAEPDPAVFHGRLLAARESLPISLQRHVDGLMELCAWVETNDRSMLPARIDAIDRWVYEPPEAVGLLLAQGMADPSILTQVLAAQRWLHQALSRLGLELICPVAGDAFDSTLHLCPERDILYVNEGPREDRVLALTHIGYRNGVTGAVLRRALVKRSVYVGEIEEEAAEPNPMEPNPVESVEPVEQKRELGE